MRARNRRRQDLRTPPAQLPAARTHSMGKVRKGFTALKQSQFVYSTVPADLLIRVYPGNWPNRRPGHFLAPPYPIKQNFEWVPKGMRGTDTDAKYGVIVFDKNLFQIKGVANRNPTVADLVKNAEGNDPSSVGEELHKYYSTYKVVEVKTKKRIIFFSRTQVHHRNSPVEMKSLKERNDRRLEVALYLGGPAVLKGPARHKDATAPAGGRKGTIAAGGMVGHLGPVNGAQRKIAPRK